MQHMPGIKKKLSPRTCAMVLLALVAVAFMVCGNSWRGAVAPAAWAISVAYAIAGARAGGFRRSRYNLLLAAAGALYIALTLLRRDFSAYAWSNLGLCSAALLTGLVPARQDRADVVREMHVLALTTVLAYLPFVLVALASVFTATPIFLVNPEQAVGIQKLGAISGRIYIGVHPNYSAQICVHCILFTLYLAANHRRRWQRALLALVCAAYVLALTHAQSRSGTILLGVALGALLFRWCWRRFDDRRAAVAAGLALAAAAIVGTLLLTNLIFKADVRLAKQLNPWLQKKQASSSRVLTSGVLELTENGRGKIWGGVLRYLKARPLTLLVGRGAGTVFRYIMPYFDGRNYGYLHNNWLEILVRGGVPMALLMCALLLTLVRPCARQLVRPAADGDALGCVRPVVILVLVAVTISESMLLVYASFPNILFFAMSGQVMALDEMDRADA